MNAYSFTYNTEGGYYNNDIINFSIYLPHLEHA